MNLHLLLLQISNGVVWQTRDLHLSCNMLYLLSLRLCSFIVSICDLIVNRNDSDKLEGYHANQTTNEMFCTTSETETEVGAIKSI